MKNSSDEENKEKNIEELLKVASNGGLEAFNGIMTLIYPELKKKAHHLLQNERPGHTLQTTELVDEAYLRIVRSNSQNWTNKIHFFLVAARMMRHILVDHARKRLSLKRGESKNIPLAELEQDPSKKEDERLVRLHEALDKLSLSNHIAAKIIDCLYFAGYSIEETANYLELTPAVVKSKWEFAKAWLARELK